MTTAHRPTFDTARGGKGKNETDLAKISQQYSARDMPSHTVLKYRQPGQTTKDEVSERDLRKDLGDRERRHRDEKKSGQQALSGGGKRARIEAAPVSQLDADDPVDADSSSDDSDSDDEAELMAELAKIKKERAVVREEKEAEDNERQERIRTDNILHGNPLLSGESSSANEFKVKRRWDDDVVFKNCAKGLEERAQAPTFINDAIRSEFHKRFMDKYIK